MPASIWTAAVCAALTELRLTVTWSLAPVTRISGSGPNARAMYRWSIVTREESATTTGEVLAWTPKPWITTSVAPLTVNAGVPLPWT